MIPLHAAIKAKRDGFESFFSALRFLRRKQYLYTVAIFREVRVGTFQQFHYRRRRSNELIRSNCLRLNLFVGCLRKTIVHCGGSSGPAVNDLVACFQVLTRNTN